MVSTNDIKNLVVGIIGGIYTFSYMIGLMVVCSKNKPVRQEEIQIEGH